MSAWKPWQHAPGVWSVAREVPRFEYLKLTPHRHLTYHEARKLAREANTLNRGVAE